MTLVRTFSKVNGSLVATWAKAPAKAPAPVAPRLSMTFIKPADHIEIRWSKR